MSIFTASYFETENHHGELVSISRSVPKGFKVAQKLRFLTPSPAILKSWKDQAISEEEYTAHFRAQLKSSWEQIKPWLDELDPSNVLTLLCWEPQGSFCHRNLVAQMIQKFRPDCFGGCDIRRIEPRRIEIPLCNRCSSRIIPGLDACWCPSCQLWLKPSTLEPIS